MAYTDTECTRAEAAYGSIKGLLTSGQLKPNQYLQIQDLADQLKLSATPVREALSKLAFEDLLRFTPNRGYFVKAYDLIEQTEIHTLFDIILFSAMERISDELAVYGGNDSDLCSAIDRLYLRLIAVHRNSRIDAVYSNYRDRTQHLRSLACQDEGFAARTRNFIQIYKVALRARNLQGATQALASHRSDFLTALLSAISQTVTSHLHISRLPFQEGKPEALRQTPQGVWRQSRDPASLCGGADGAQTDQTGAALGQLSQRSPKGRAPLSRVSCVSPSVA